MMGLMTEPTSGQPVPPQDDNSSAEAQQNPNFTQPYPAQQQQQQQPPQTQPQAQYGYPQANYGQQQAQGSDFFAKLPMTPLTAGLFVGGLAMLLFSTLLHGAGSDAILLMRALSPFSLAPMYAILVIAAIVVSTGPKFRPVLRLVALSLAVVEFGMTMSIFMLDPISSDNPVTGGSTEAATPDGGADIVGSLLFLIAIGLLVACTFTMKERSNQAQQQYPTGGTPTGYVTQSPVQTQQTAQPNYQSGQASPTQWQQ